MAHVHSGPSGWRVVTSAFGALLVQLVDSVGDAFGTLLKPIRNEQVGKASSELVDAAGNPIGQNIANPLVVTGAAVIGGAVTEADGANVALGATTDAAVDTDVAGTLSGKMRGLVKLLASVIAGGRIRVTPDSVALPANQSVNVAQINGVAPLMGAGNTGTGSPRVTIASDQAAIPATPNAATTGGATPYHFIAAGGADQDSTVVKASAGQVYSIAGMCAVATPRYLKLYNKATAPTSADTPVHTLMIPANGTTGAGFAFSPAVGLKFTAGISFRLTTGMADNDAGACGAADCVINLGWI